MRNIKIAPVNSPTSNLKRRSPGLMALEQRFMFDGAALTDATQTLSDASATVKSSTTLAADLAKAEQAARTQALDFLNRATDQTLFQLFNGGANAPDEAWAQRLSDIKAILAQPDAPFQMRTMEQASQFTAVAAFAAEGPDGKPTIFVNPYWMGLLDNQDMANVLVEEVGHWIDSVLNPGADTPQDEGEVFANQVLGENSLVSDATLSDSGWVVVDGERYQVEFAQYQFVGAYEMVYDLNNNGTIEGNLGETAAEKEQNLHKFNAGNNLGAVRINDGSNGVNFSGNDISAIAINIGGTDYYGWVSRPIKANGVVRGFYFWTDPDFTTLALAQADGNQDGDSNASDNRGFVLVVDQSWFNTQITNTGTLYTINNAKDGNLGSINVANVGSSSDRVDSALNSLVTSNTAPVATNDTTTGVPDASTAGRPALEQGYDANGSGTEITATVNATGNVLTNDTDANSDTLKVSAISSNSTGASASPSGTGAYTVAGKYGTLTIYANGNYSYAVDNTKAAVDALLSGTLSEVFSYTASDSKGGTASATLTVTINGSNDAPLAYNDYNTAKEITTSSNTGYNATGNVLTNDTDVDTSDTKTVSGASVSGSAVGGTVTVSAGSSKLTFSGNGVSSVNGGEEIYVSLTGATGNSATYSGLYSESGGVYTLVYAQTNVAVTGGYDITLNKTPTHYWNGTAYTAISNFGTFMSTYTKVLFLNSTSSTESGGGSAKEATVSSSSATGYTTLSGLSAVSGTIAVGMSVSGTGVPAGTTVSDVTLSSGIITSIKLSSDQITSTNGTTFTFTGSSGAGVTLTGLHGSVTINTNGDYTYTPTTDNPKLSSGQSAVEVFDYTMRDAAGRTSSAKLYITVYGSGSNDPTVVADTVTVYESGVGRDPNSPTTATTDKNAVFQGQNVSTTATTGTTSVTKTITTNVLSNDTAGTGGAVASYTKADGTSSTTAGTSLTGAYGNLTISSAGAVTYVVDNTNAAVQALLPTASLSETFRYKVTNTAGGVNWSTLTVTIQGTNDAPVAVADTGSALSEDGVTSASGNVLTNDTDVDSGDTKTVNRAGTSSANTSVTAGTTYADGLVVAGTYGSLRIGADGTYTYTLDNASAAVQNLAVGATATETFNYQVVDAAGATSTNTLSFTITGANEPPINNFNGTAISSTSTTTVSTTQDTALNFSAANSSLLSVGDADGNLTSITLTVDNGSLSFTSTPSNVTLSASSGGTITISGGTQAQLNAALALLRYTPNNGFTGTDYLTIASKDGSNAWDSDGIAIYVDDRALSVNAITVNEGGGYATFTLTATAGQTLTLGLSDGSSNPTATSNTDYTNSMEYWDPTANAWVPYTAAFTVPGTVNNTQTFYVRVAVTPDNVYEGPEDFKLTATYTSGTNRSVTGVATIVDNGTGTKYTNGDPTVSGPATDNTNLDDDRPTLTVTGVNNVSEGSNAIFTVTLNKALSAATLIDLGLSDVSTQSGDYSATYKWSTSASGPWTTVTANQISLAANTTTFYVMATTTADSPAVYEGAESFKLTASFNAAALKYVDGVSGTTRTGYTANANSTILDDGTGTIYNTDGTSTTVGADDDRPTLTVTGVNNVSEGSNAIFTVTLNKALSAATLIDLGLSDVSTQSGDYSATYKWSTSASGPWTTVTANQISLAANTTTFYVMATTTADSPAVYEGAESFKLTASFNAAALKYVDGVSGTTRTGYTANANSTILDDGTGTIYNTDGTSTTVGADDDRVAPLSVTGGVYNEASPRAVFTISTSAGQSLTLDVLDAADTGKAPTGDGEGGANDSLNNAPIHYSLDGGLTWSTYNGTAIVAGSVPVLVAVDITAERDTVYEGEEQLKLVVTSGTQTASAYASIVDDGTGLIQQPNEPNPDPDATKDDDRPVRVNNIEVNENSPWAVFRVNGSAGQSVTLALQNDSDSNTANATLGTDSGTQLQYFNGTAWVNYTGAVTLPAGGELLVRVAINDDDPYEGPETFQLSATPSGGSAAYGTATILDDGTGSVYPDNTTGNPDPDAPKDDDRPVRVNNIEVNENSPWAVFRVNGTAGQSVALALQNDSDPNTANAKLGTDLGTQLQYFNGTSWVDYTGAVTLPAGGELLVRVAINDDDPFEGPETFQLSATPSGGSAAYGTATILDDGTGSIFPNNNTGNPDPDAVKDDDRPVRVNNIEVNENSPWAVFRVNGTAGQSVTLALQNDNDPNTANAKLGTDLGTQLQYFNGTAWVDYTGAVNLPTGGELLVRVAINDDDPYEGPETFQLSATPSGGSAAYGTATILDDGTGSVYPDNTTGNPDLDAVKDDDRPVRVNNIEVNENSPWAVFRVNGTAGQSVTLALQNDNDPNTADAKLGTDLGTQLQYFNGTTWVNYTGGAVTLPAGGELLVRVAINDDDPYEGPETFQLAVTPSGGAPAYGTATILDDGTGKVYPDNTTGATDPAASLDDDRPVRVNNIEVNENSPWAVFRVNGTAGQSVTLALQNDNDPNTANAKLGTDLGTQLQYFNGTAWVNYTGGAVTLPAGGELLVRVAIIDDDPYEGPESFQLAVTPSGGNTAYGTATILDDGTGKVYPDNPTGATDPTASLDDDRPVQAPPPAPPPAPPAAGPAPVLVTPPPPPPAPVQAFASTLTPLAPALVPVDPPRSLGDAVTSGSGFQIPVSETAPPGLTLYQGVTDQFVQTTNAVSRISLPFDAFIHSNKDAVIKLDAKLADDSRLPNWVQFDPASGTFQVNPPANFKGKLDIKVVARDDDGREAVAIFQMFIGEQSQAPAGPQSRESFSEKLRMAGKRPITWVRVGEVTQIKAPVAAREVSTVQRARIG